MKSHFAYLSFLLLFCASFACYGDEFWLRGQQAYDSGLYSEAIENFERALEECDEGHRSKLSICLAEAYYRCQRDTDCLAILETMTLSEGTKLLAALAHKRLNNLPQARSLLQTCSQPLAKWHLGHAAYLQGDEIAAEVAWKELVSQNQQNDMVKLAELFFSETRP